MKVFRLGGLWFALGGVFLSFGLTALGQDMSSSASVSRSRALANSGKATPGRTYYKTATFTPPDEVAVEEFVNYHKHRLPLPKVGQGVAMDVRWGNDEVSRN